MEIILAAAEPATLILMAQGVFCLLLFVGFRRFRRRGRTTTTVELPQQHETPMRRAA